jgi:hypothetical protein
MIAIENAFDRAPGTITPPPDRLLRGADEAGAGEWSLFWTPAAKLGPVNAMDANANAWHGPPIKAADEVKTWRLREENNAEWRPVPRVPLGLLPKTPRAALQSLVGCPTRLRLRALRRAFLAVQRVCAHSVNRP